MKVSKWRVLLLLAFSLLMISGIVGGLCAESLFLSDDWFGCDLRFRRNEILCAHQGVNSFRIWNREIALDGFIPHPRPDKPDVVRKANERIVHAYPAWHTLFFYFYGWLSESVCVGVMSLFFGVCMKYVVDEILSASQKIAPFGGIVAGLTLLMVVSSFVKCFCVLNYGIFMTALFLLMRKCINLDYQVRAGLCWSLMMIKPQVGILFFWPLLWHKKYKAILVAILVCVCSSCMTAVLVNESPIDLMLQISQIGKPYSGYYFVDEFLKPIIGESAVWLWMGGVFVLCGLLAYFSKGASDFIVSSAPVVAFIPIWTYSQNHDHGILLGWFFSTAVCALKCKWWRLYWCAYIFVFVVSCCWSVVSGGLGICCHMLNNLHCIVSHSFEAVTVGAAVLFSLQVYRRKHSLAFSMC